MKVETNGKVVWRLLDKTPKCPNCSGLLTFMPDGMGVYYCGLEGIYYEVTPKEKGFSYKKIGVFG